MVSSLDNLTDEQRAYLESLGPIDPIGTPTPVTTLPKAPVPIRTPEQEALLDASLAETEVEDDDEAEVESLEDLMARSKVWVPVYPEHPRRLKVAYLPIVAADAGVAAKAMRIMSLASQADKLERGDPAAAKALRERVDAQMEAGEITQEERDAIGQRYSMDQLAAFDVDAFVGLIEEIKGHMADYLSTVCPEWSLKKDPISRDMLMRAGLAIMQDIFKAIRNRDTKRTATKNGSGSA